MFFVTHHSIFTFYLYCSSSLFLFWLILFIMSVVFIFGLFWFCFLLCSLLFFPFSPLPPPSFWINSLNETALFFAKIYFLVLLPPPQRGTGARSTQRDSINPLFLFFLTWVVSIHRKSRVSQLLLCANKTLIQSFLIHSTIETAQDLPSCSWKNSAEQNNACQVGHARRQFFTLRGFLSKNS